MKIERIQYPNRSALAPHQAIKSRSDASHTETTDAVDFDGSKQEERQKHHQSQQDGNSSFDGQTETQPPIPLKKTSGIDVVV